MIIDHFFISVQCIVCMFYDLYCFLRLTFCQFLKYFCTLICAIAAEKQKTYNIHIYFLEKKTDLKGFKKSKQTRNPDGT